MTIAATISADLRARATFLPYCPLCSFVNVREVPDILHAPHMREFRGKWKIERCCALSTTSERFDTAALASAWWRARRMEPLKDPASESRRKNCIAKLAAKNLEPIQ